MSVTFANDLVEIKEYKVESHEKTEKKKALDRIKRNSDMKAWLSRILYASFVSEDDYVKLRMDGKKVIRCVVKCTYIWRYIELYNKDYGLKSLSYSLYENQFGKLVLHLESKGLYHDKKVELHCFDQGNSLEDIMIAEYKAKMKLIEIVKNICEKNEIY